MPDILYIIKHTYVELSVKFIIMASACHDYISRSFQKKELFLVAIHFIIYSSISFALPYPYYIFLIQYLLAVSWEEIFDLIHDYHVIQYVEYWMIFLYVESFDDVAYSNEHPNDLQYDYIILQFESAVCKQKKISDDKR